MKHINFVKRGWITLDVTPSTVQADFWEIDGVEWDDTGDATFRTAFRTTAGSRRLEMAAEPTSARANAAELAPEMPLPEIPVERQT
ncbi:MAG: hypothetical protein H6721_08555 [Sandaracinus sp.]|nr:hypothetical protein [Sandaracinus sp.]